MANRPYSLRVRVSSEELIDWAYQAELSAMSKSEWIREKCNPPKRKTNLDPEDERVAYHEKMAKAWKALVDAGFDARIIEHAPVFDRWGCSRDGAIEVTFFIT